MTTDTADTSNRTTAAGTRDQVNQWADKAKGFAKARPAATAALAGVLGLALINTLRGR